MRNIAVLVHGQPRFINYTWDFIKEEYNIPDAKTYFFGHLWDLVGYVPEDDKNRKYVKHNILDNIQNDFTSLEIDNYQNLDKFITNFHPKIKYILNGKYRGVKDIRELRYRYGQSYSRRQVHILMEKYEQKNNIKFDIVIIIKTDFLYKNEQCYKNKKEYIERKIKLYANNNNIPITYNSNIIKNCNLTVKPYTTHDQLLGTIGDWYTRDIYHLKNINNGILVDKDDKELTNINKLTTRLQINDHLLICSRDVSQYFCKEWYTSVLRLLKSVVTSSEICKEDKAQIGRTRIRCPFELYGEILLNYKINAIRINKHFKRVVNINNCKEKFFETRRQVIFCEFREIKTEQEFMQKKLIEVFT